MALTPLYVKTRVLSGLGDGLACAEVCHDSLVDLASEKTFQAPDDLPFGSAGRRAACDVINGRLMVPHADDDGSIEGGVRTNPVGIIAEDDQQFGRGVGAHTEALTFLREIEL